MAIRFVLLSLVITNLVTSVKFVSAKCDTEPHCKLLKVYSMSSADCSNLSLERFPKCVRSNVEILDLGLNRIRKITAEDLERFSDLKFLYLYDNMIGKIEPDTFAAKTSLETLDLSKNGLYRLPETIFHLPSLRKLSLKENVDLLETLVDMKVTSPLMHLDLSYSYEGLGIKLPNFGILPELTSYNVSGMNLILRTGDTAGMCNLKHFHNEKSKAYFEEPCDCWNIKTWFQQRGVNYQNFVCTIEEESCGFNITEDAMGLYNECSKQYAQVLETRMIKNVITITAIVLGIICLLVLLLLIKLRRDRVKRRKIKRRLALKGEKNTVV